MSEIDDTSPRMTPQISPKDIPQNKSDSETEEDNVVSNIDDESSSSDDGDGDVVNEISGYVPLSTNDGNDEGYSNTIEFEESSENLQEETADQPACSSSKSEDQLTMDTDQVNLIQQVMSNISLPSSSIPEWARVVPEDKWKNSLLTSLENRTTPKADCTENNN